MINSSQLDSRIIGDYFLASFYFHHSFISFLAYCLWRYLLVFREGVLLQKNKRTNTQRLRGGSESRLWESSEALSATSCIWNELAGQSTPGPTCWVERVRSSLTWTRTTDVWTSTMIELMSPLRGWLRWEWSCNGTVNTARSHAYRRARGEDSQRPTLGK